MRNGLVISKATPWIFAVAAPALILLAGPAHADNPIITHKYTADPAAMVHEGTVYLYTGHDQADARRNTYDMRQWLCFSSTDMVTWTEHPSPLAVKDFEWAKADAWAGHVVHHKGKSYFIYHNGGIPTQGGSFHRSVCIDPLYYNPDGTMKRVIMTSEGIAPAR